MLRRLLTGRRDVLLQKLRDYSDRLNLPPTLYSEAPVRYIVELDATGRLLNPGPTDTSDPASPRTRRGVRRFIPQVQRNSAIKPLLLVGNAEYTLGLARERSKPERVAACHRAYLDLLRRCAVECEEPAVQAVQNFLDSDPVSQLRLEDDFDRGAAITFRVDGSFVVDLPGVQHFWAQVNEPVNAPRMQCLVCGHERPALDRLQAKIKGIPGGQTSGTSIISANADAFLSYGLKASLIAPTCADCGERFTKAINDLLGSEQHSIRFNNAVFAFWTREETAFNPVSFFKDPKPEEVRALLESPLTGRQMPELDETRFYAVALSGSGGRAVVRDWIDTTVGEVKGRLGLWFLRQQIVDERGDEMRPLGLYALAGATVRDLRDLPAPTTRALLRCALAGTPLPPDMLAQAVRRNRAEQTVTRPRAALIKLVFLTWQTDRKDDEMVQLDSDHANPGYHCGRLLAVLEQVQRAAIPRLSATIVGRFYGTASSAPGSVFPRLLRGAQPHLAKLERDRPGAYRALQLRLEEVLARLQDFPRTLTLTDQGLFALGYYHQRAYDRARARKAGERRRADDDSKQADNGEA